MTIRLIGVTVLLATALWSPVQANDASPPSDTSARRVEAIPLPRARPVAVRKPLVVRTFVRRSNPRFVVPHYAEVGNGRSCHLLCPVMGVRF